MQKQSTSHRGESNRIHNIHDLQSSYENRILDKNGRLAYLHPSDEVDNLFEIIRPNGEVVKLPMNEQIVKLNGQFTISRAFESLRTAHTSIRCMIFSYESQAA